MTAFTSAWLKWARAVVHAQALEAQVNHFADESRTKPFASLKTDYDPKRHGFSVRVESVSALPPSWNLLLGDFVSNIHHALDHIAWEVVQRGSPSQLTGKQLEGVYFPITNSANHFKKVLPTKLPHARRADIAIIRRAQPYVHGKTRVGWHCLTILNQISTGDKHRSIQEIGMIPDAYELNILETTDCVIADRNAQAEPRLLVTNAELAFIRARKCGPNPRIHMEYRFTSHPTVHPRLRLGDWVQITTVATMGLLSEFAPPPREIVELGIDLAHLNRSRGAWMDALTKWSEEPRLKRPNIWPLIGR